MGSFDLRKRMSHTRFRVVDSYSRYADGPWTNATTSSERITSYKSVYSFRTAVGANTQREKGTKMRRRKPNSIHPLDPERTKLRAMHARAERIRRRLAYQLDPHPAEFREYQVVHKPGVEVKFLAARDGYYYKTSPESLIFSVFVTQPVWYPTKPIRPELPITSCYNDALEKQRSMEVDFGTAIGELKATLSSLRNPLATLHKGLREWAKVSRPQRGRSAKKIVEVATDSWLEYRYGIMPNVYLLSDVLSAIASASRPSLRITKGSHYPVKSEETSLGSCTTVWFQVEYLKHVQRETKATFTICGLHEPNTLEKFGLDFYNLPRIALELTPYSFVVEWFFDVSGWLNHFLPHPSWSEKYTLNSVKHVEKTTYTDVRTFIPGYGSGRTHSRVYTFDSHMIRIKNPIIGHSIQLGDGLKNLKRIADSISLSFKPTLSVMQHLRRKP